MQSLQNSNALSNDSFVRLTYREKVPVSSMQEILKSVLTEELTSKYNIHKNICILYWIYEYF